MRTSLAPDALRLLGLARRAGAVAVGAGAVREAVRAGEARLVVMARDASPVQLEKIRKAMRAHSIPQVVLGDRDALGVAVGRAPLSAVAVVSDSFAKRLLTELGGARDESGVDVDVDLEA